MDKATVKTGAAELEKSQNEVVRHNAQRTIDEHKSHLMFQKIAAADINAVRQCVNNYGNLVWSLAKKLTDSTVEAEAATLEIFLDIWKHAEHFDESNTSEEDFITLVALRYLIKRKRGRFPGWSKAEL